MDDLGYFEPETPQALPGQWLNITYRRKVYVPHVVRVRKRVFSAELLKTLRPKGYRHAHRIYHLVYFLGGANAIFLDNGVREIHEGQLALINPDALHDLVPHQAKACAFLTLMFSYRSGKTELHIPFSQLLAQVTGKETEMESVVEDRGGRLRSYFACLENDVLEKRNRRLEKISYCLAGLFNELIGLSLRLEDTPPMPEDVLAVRTFMLQNLDRDVTVKHLMQISHLSRSCLMEKFKRHTGMSPIDYLIRERIEKAKTYLIYSSRRVKEIAALCGFHSEYYFNKTFKKRTRLTPGQYRKSRKNTAE